MSNTSSLSWDDIKIEAQKQLQSKQLDNLYHKRLLFELNEIDKQGTTIYWQNLVRDNKKFTQNKNKLVLPWVLGMIEDDPLQDPDGIICTARYSEIRKYQAEHGKLPLGIIKDSDMPDIDIDCLPQARESIKKHAVEKYGAADDGYGSVCSVGTWTTYKFKSAIVDVAFAIGDSCPIPGTNQYYPACAKADVYELTTKLPDEVDELRNSGVSSCKGKVNDKECKFVHGEEKCPKCGSTETDSPTIAQLLAEFDTLRAFASKYPHIIGWAIRIVGCIKSMGMHAGAIIIADRPLYGNIPLAKNAKHGFWVSMWPEGRSTQLSKFGYVKWDILGLKTLNYIYNCCRLIQENKGVYFGDIKALEQVVASEGIAVDSLVAMDGWDDIDPHQNKAGHYFKDGVKHYIELNDKAVLQMANDIKTDTIFQFDTELAKSILSNGVRNFNDLLLLNAMGHPGPIASIPEAIANREEFIKHGENASWRKKLSDIHNELLQILSDTHGVICHHEDTLVSLVDGNHIPIRDTYAGLEVHSVDWDKKIVRSNIVRGCAESETQDGLSITLNNNYNIVVTKDHEIYGYDGKKKACDLEVGDLVAVPCCAPQGIHTDDFKKLTQWLGNDDDCAYLVGQLLGDGALTSTSYALCVGSKDDADILNQWVFDHISLRCRPYFHCRSWYIGLSNSTKTEKQTVLPLFEDTEEWWELAYSIYSGSDIAGAIGRSTWFVYNRLRKFSVITNQRKRSHKTKWHDLVERLQINCNFYNKRIPKEILCGPNHVRAACLAGLLDSDGAIENRSCYITSVSKLLLEDIRQLLSTFGLISSFSNCGKRIYIWSMAQLSKIVSSYLLIKQFDETTTGESVGEIPKCDFIAHVRDNYNSYRDFSKKTGVSRAVFNYPYEYVKTSTARKAGMNLGDIRYHRIINIQEISNQKFYDISVENDHNLIANGILSSNCWQEQLTTIWQRLGCFSSTEAQEARKAVAKKWGDKLKGIEEKWLSGASATIGSEAAKELYEKMVSFGRYAFNLSHGVAYCLVAFRCLWLKAHFPAEWWASVMSDCHPDKLIRYMGVARSEGVEFDTLNVNHLTTNFTVTGDKINQGLVSVKGVGEKACEHYTRKKSECTSIDGFISDYGAKRIIMERLIKLGAFNKYHPNSKAAWIYYQYKYGTGTESTQLKKTINQLFLDKMGWTETTIANEIKRQTSEFKKQFPKRNKIPNKILNWKPTVKKYLESKSREQVIVQDIEELYVGDEYTLAEILSFEKEYLGYYLNSPMDLYNLEDGLSIDDAKKLATQRQNDGSNDTSVCISAIVTSFNECTAKTGSKFGRVIISDGTQSALLLIWEKYLYKQPANFKPGGASHAEDNKIRRNWDLLKPNSGIKVYVEYDYKRGSFTMASGEPILRLKPKDATQ